MPQSITVSSRKTHRYAEGWSDNDQWKTVGQVKLLPSRTTRPGQDHDDGGTYLVHAVSKQRMATAPQAKLMAKSLAETLGGTRCRHEYDCCGCAIRSAHVIHRDRRHFVVKVDVRFNY